MAASDAGDAAAVAVAAQEAQPAGCAGSDSSTVAAVQGAGATNVPGAEAVNVVARVLARLSMQQAEVGSAAAEADDQVAPAAEEETLAADTPVLQAAPSAAAAAPPASEASEEAARVACLDSMVDHVAQVTAGEDGSAAEEASAGGEAEDVHPLGDGPPLAVTAAAEGAPVPEGVARTEPAGAELTGPEELPIKGPAEERSVDEEAAAKKSPAEEPAVSAAETPAAEGLTAAAAVEAGAAEGPGAGELVPAEEPAAEVCPAAEGPAPDALDAEDPAVVEERAAAEERRAVEERPTTADPAAANEPVPDGLAAVVAAVDPAVQAAASTATASTAASTLLAAADEPLAPWEEAADELASEVGNEPSAPVAAAGVGPSLESCASVADDDEKRVGEAVQLLGSPAAPLVAESELQQAGTATGAASDSQECSSLPSQPDEQAEAGLPATVEPVAAVEVEVGAEEAAVKEAEPAAEAEQPMPEAEAVGDVAQLAEAPEPPAAEEGAAEAGSGAMQAVLVEQPPCEVDAAANELAEKGDAVEPLALLTMGDSADAQAASSAAVTEQPEGAPHTVPDAEAPASAEQQAGEQEAESDQPAQVGEVEVETEQPVCSTEQPAVPSDAPPGELSDQPGAEAALPEKQEPQGDGPAVGQTTSAFLEGSLAAISEESYSQLLQREVSAKLMQVLSEQQLAVAASAQQGLEEDDEEPCPSALPPGQSTPGAGMATAPAALILPAGSLLAAPSGAQPAEFDEPLLKWNPVAKRAGPHSGRVQPVAAVPHGAAQLGSPPAAHSPTHSRRMAPLHGPSSPSAVPDSRPVAAPASRPKPGSHMAPLSRTAPEAAGNGPDPASRLRRLSKPSMSEILAAAGAKPRPAKSTGSRGGSAGWASTHLMTAPPPVAPHLPPMQLPGAGLPPAAFPLLHPGAGPTGSDALLNWGRRGMAAPPTAALPGGWFIPAPAGFGGAPIHPLPPTEFAPEGLQPQHLAAGADGEAPAEGAVLPASAGYAGEHAPADAGASPTNLPAEAGASSSLPSSGPGLAGMQGNSGGWLAPPADGEVVLAEEQAHPYAPNAATTSPGPHLDVNVAASWPPYEGAKLPPLYEDQLVGGAGLIPAVHSAASFSASPGRRGYPAPSSAGSPAWHAASPPAHLAYLAQQAPAAGYYMPAPQQVPAGWAGQAMAMPSQWGAPLGGPTMRSAPPLLQGPSGVPEPAPGQQGPVHYQPPELSAEQQQALYYQQLQAQQHQAYMWQAQQSQYLLHQQAQAQAQMAAWQQALAQGLHPDVPLFAREPMPQVPVALDPSGRPFKVFHGVAARSIRKPERYQPDGRPAWAR